MGFSIISGQQLLKHSVYERCVTLLQIYGNVVDNICALRVLYLYTPPVYGEICGVQSISFSLTTSQLINCSIFIKASCRPTLYNLENHSIVK